MARDGAGGKAARAHPRCYSRRVRRALTTFDMTCIGVNAIIGSGIYLFPGRLHESLGPASLVAFVLTGALCLPVALCFANLGRTEERSGGPYRYAQIAFGPSVGFVVGWSAWVTALVSWAAVASGLSRYLSHFWPAAARPGVAHLVAAVVVVGLGALNYRGVKPGARLTDVMTVGKLVPLLLFIVLGAFAIRGRHLAPFAPHGWGALPSAALMTMFAYQGFEVVGVPAGEVKNPRIAIPFAVFWSLMLSAAVYALVQLVFVGVGGAGTNAPLAGAARTFLGARGADLVALGGLVSIFGFNCGTALCTPRYLSALAEDKVLPERLARPHPRFETPGLSIVVSTGLVLVLTQILDFESLVDIAVLAVLGQYVATCAALVKLGPSKGARILGVVGIAVSIAFGVQATVEQLTVNVALLAVGVFCAGLTRLFARRTV